MCACGQLTQSAQHVAVACRDRVTHNAPDGLRRLEATTRTLLGSWLGLRSVRHRKNVDFIHFYVCEARDSMQYRPTECKLRLFGQKTLWLRL